MRSSSDFSANVFGTAHHFRFAVKFCYVLGRPLLFSVHGNCRVRKTDGSVTAASLYCCTVVVCCHIHRRKLACYICCLICHYLLPHLRLPHCNSLLLHSPPLSYLSLLSHPYNVPFTAATSTAENSPVIFVGWLHL